MVTGRLTMHVPLTDMVMVIMLLRLRFMLIHVVIMAGRLMAQDIHEDITTEVGGVGNKLLIY